MPVWTADQARTHILRQHGLLERYPDPIDAIKATTVIQTQYAVSLTPALYARAKTVTDKRTEQMLQKERSLVKTWANRSTVHTLATDDYPMVVGAIGAQFDPLYRKWLGKLHEAVPGGYDLVREQMLEALDQGPLTREDLHSRVAALKNLKWSGWGHDVKGLAYEGRLVFAQQGASRTTFAGVRHWLPDVKFDLSQFTTGDLLLRYVSGHGPARLDDFRMWTMFYAPMAKKSLEFARDHLDEVTLDGRPGVHYVLKGTHPPEPEMGTPRLLAKFDPLVMGWKDRLLFLDAKHTKKVVRIAAQIEATVLLDNRIQGVWRLGRKGTKAEIAICWFDRPGVRKLKATEREAEALGHALGYGQTDVVERDI